MTAPHTQGRLVVGQDGMPEHRNVANFLESKSGRLVAYGQMTEADARRLAACWNACEGLSTAQLTAMKPPVRARIHEVAEQRDAAIAERDQLRAELDQARALLADILKADDEARASLQALGIGLTAEESEAVTLTERIRALLDTDQPNMLPAQPLTTIAEQARRLVDAAGRMGVVLTVSQSPRLPLAMGNYETVIEVRPARGCY
jgi:hypothetical protein